MKITTLIVALALSTAAQAESILVQSTTSTQNSGLYEYILPIFTAETGIDVHVVAVGTGQAIRNAVNGDADVLLVHAKAAEEEFITNGWGVERFNLMYNDFVIIGPDHDPAGLSGAKDVNTAMAILAESDAIFVSRGDDSGTHKKELSLWIDSGVVVENGMNYRETGSGMGATIRAAIEMQGYTMTDRATWIAFGNKQNVKILFEGDAALFNQYGIIMVNPAVHPHVKSEAAQAFIEWMLGAGQMNIGLYMRDNQQLFFPNAG